MKSDSDAETHVLIALCGMSPAVVTETVFSLAEAGDPPEQVIVITTSAGADGLREKIWDSGVWKRLTEKLRIKVGFALNHRHLRLLPDGDHDAADVDSQSTVEHAASFILDVLRQYTENPDTRVTFSIAGGRKTMSALGALCMSLLGRRRDRLCHILVNAPFDDPSLTPGFYFPEPGRVHVDRDGAAHDSGCAVLTLSFLPFVQCRYLIEKELQRLPGDYVRMVNQANENVEGLDRTKTLELETESLTVRIGENAFHLQPLLFLIYWMLARRCLDGQPPLYNRKDLCDEFCSFVEHSLDDVPQRYYYSCQALLEQGRIKVDTLGKRVNDLGAELKRRGVPASFMPTCGRGVYGIGTDPERIRIRTSAGSPETCRRGQSGL